MVPEQLRGQRMRAQQLTGRQPKTVAGAIVALQAIQAQSPPATRLAIRARTAGLVAADVDASIAAREVVRTWLMRGTLHLVPAADVRWLVELYRPVLLAAGRRRRLQLGLDDELCTRALPIIEAGLRGGSPLTRAQLRERLAAGGIALEARSQAPIHLIAYAAHQGLVVRGPETGTDEATYVLLDEWVPDTGEKPDDPVAELARRYVGGHGPAEEPDFRAWSGLPAALTKAAFADVATPSIEDSAAVPKLLGHFDEYLLGYRSRDLVLDPRFAERIRAGGGMIQPAAVVDGRVVGTWKAEKKRATLAITLDPFEPIADRARKGLRAEAEDIARFLGATNLQFN